MSWKKSDDGGVDYDVEYEIKKHKMEERHRLANEKLQERYDDAKKQMFDPFATAVTMTFNTNTEHVEF